LNFDFWVAVIHYSLLNILTRPEFSLQKLLLILVFVYNQFSTLIKCRFSSVNFNP